MNNVHRWITISLASVSLCGASWAATVVKRDIQGQTQDIVMEGQQVRIQTKEPNYYTLMALDKGKVYMVDNKEKRIVEMDIVGKPPEPPRGMPQHKPKPPWGDSVKAKLVKRGNGPKIAGYSTKHYQLKALDKACSDYYFSKTAAQVDYIEAFIDASNKMVNSRKVKGMPVHPCQQAQDELEADMKKHGVSLKLVFKGGKDHVMYEITSIQTGVKVPASVFALPTTGYKTMSEQNMIEEEQAKMKEWMEKRRQSGEGRQRGGPYQHPPPR